ncbi:hypothetical protein [Flectobacillus roseus]|uniref:hypothetical protein n=1 Tax=Flectobacillus roseus TaxID=502259 RepID=UPI0024B75061|nr:hypothetical protein [Flectobacillus roseus]MDI9867733.1 hypothetical protein [Flectobacillus roseus]
MELLQKISQEILTVSGIEMQFVKCQIEIFTNEKGSGITGECFDSNNLKVSYLDVFELNHDFNDWIQEWFNMSGISQNRWNKAELTVYKDGKYEVRTWWDSEFQILLYGEDN